jgi:hypothetical protein
MFWLDCQQEESEEAYERIEPSLLAEKEIQEGSAGIHCCVRSNIVWGTDFTKVRIDGKGWVHLIAYTDLYFRKIKGI